MPEGDTVWRTAARLHEALAGERLERADLRWPSLATADLRGARTLEVRSRGKHLLHRLDTGLTLPVSYTHLPAHETVLDLVCRLLLEKKTTHMHMHTYQLAIQPNRIR